jgi:hypothetical protein
LSGSPLNHYSSPVRSVYFVAEGDPARAEAIVAAQPANIPKSTQMGWTGRAPARPERRNVMVKMTKTVVEAAEAEEKDYLIWDDELPGFGLRVFSSDHFENRQLDHKAITVKELCTPISLISRPDLSSEKAVDRRSRRQSPPTLAVLSVTSFR